MKMRDLIDTVSSLYDGRKVREERAVRRFSGKRPERPRMYLYYHQTINGWPNAGERFWVQTDRVENWESLRNAQLPEDIMPNEQVGEIIQSGDEDTAQDITLTAFVAPNRSVADAVMRDHIKKYYAIKDLERYKGWFRPETNEPPSFEPYHAPRAVPREPKPLDDNEIPF